MATPIPRTLKTRAEHRAHHDARAIGAERDANADLALPPGHRVREHRVQARQQQPAAIRPSRPRAAHRGPIGQQRERGQLVTGCRRSNRQIADRCGECSAADPPACTPDPGRGAHDQHRRRGVALRQREEDRRRAAIHRAPCTCRLDDPDDLHRCAVAALAELAANAHPPRKQALGQRVLITATAGDVAVSKSLKSRPSRRGICRFAKKPGDTE